MFALKYGNIFTHDSLVSLHASNFRLLRWILHLRERIKYDNFSTWPTLKNRSTNKLYKPATCSLWERAYSVEIIHHTWQFHPAILGGQDSSHSCVHPVVWAPRKAALDPQKDSDDSQLQGTPASRHSKPNYMSLVGGLITDGIW